MQKPEYKQAKKHDYKIVQGHLQATYICKKHHSEIFKIVYKFHIRNSFEWCSRKEYSLALAKVGGYKNKVPG